MSKGLHGRFDIVLDDVQPLLSAEHGTLMCFAQKFGPEFSRCELFVTLPVTLKVLIEDFDDTVLGTPEFVSKPERNQFILTLDPFHILRETRCSIKFDTDEFLPLQQYAWLRCKVVYRYPDVAAVTGIDVESIVD